MTDDSPADDSRTAPTPTDAPAGVDPDRYARLSLEDGAVIVYDRARTDAWIQSDVTVTLPEAPPIGPRVPAETGGNDRAASGGD